MEEKELDLSAFDETSNDLDLSAFDEPVKKKAPTSGYKPLVEKPSTTQKESTSPYQDPLLKSKSDSSTLKSTDSSSESSDYSYTFGKPKPVEQPKAVYTIGGEAVEGIMSGDKASESVPLSIVQKAGMLKQELSEKSKELSLFNTDIESGLAAQKGQYDELAKQLAATPKEDPSYNYLVEQLNSLSDNANGAIAKLNENNEKLNSINKASFMADQAEEVGRNLKVEEDATAGGIFAKSAWNAFAPATIKGIGALTSLTGAVQSPFSYSQADYDQTNAELTNTLGAEKAKEVLTKLTETLNGNKSLQSAGNFIVDLGNKLEADVPESSKGSVLDGFTLNKAMNLAGSGVGSMAAMLLPAGAIGSAGKGAQLATAWGSSSMQTMGGVYDEAKQKGLSDEHAAYLSLAIGLPVGAVDAVAGARFFGSKKAAKELVDAAIKELGGRSITPTILSEVADKSVKQVLKNKAVDIGSEALTGGVQQVIEEVGKAYSDKISGKDTFKVTLDSALKNTFDSAFGEAFGAASVGVLNWDGKTTESAYKQALKVNQNQASREYFQKMLSTSVANGVIDERQAENIKNNINAIIIADKKIPSNIKDESRLDAIELIKEKTALENEIEGKDKELVAPELKKIEEINFKLNSIASDRKVVKMERKDLGGKKDVPPAVEKTVADTKVQATEPSVSNEEIEQLKFNKSVGMELTPEEQAMLDASTPKQPAQQSRPITTNATNSVSKIKALPAEEENGVTLNLDGTEYNEGGVVIPITSENITQEELTPERVQAFVEKHSNKIPEGSSVKPGIYKFPGSNMVSLDLNIVVPKDKAANAVEFAREAGQESVFDLDTMTNQKTGATGENPTQFTDEQFFEIADSLSKGKKPNIISNKAKEQFITDGIESLKIMEDADYDPANDDVYREYFGKRYDYLNEKGIPKEEVQLREKVLSSTDKVISALSKVAPGIKIIPHTTKQSFGEALGETDTKQNKLGGGFFDPNTNEIHLNLEEIKSNTLFHEGVHPVLNAIEAANPAAIDKLYNQVVEAEKRAGVEGKYSREFASRYEESQQKMEAVTEFIADVADGTIEVNESNFDKVKQFFVDLMAVIGIDVSSKIKTVGDLKKLAENISSAFKTGEEVKVESAGVKSGKLMFQATDYGDSGIRKEPALDKNEYKKEVESGRIKVVNPYKSLKDKFFAITFPDDLFVGDIIVNGKKIAQGLGGVFYTAKYGSEGIAWASVGEKSAHNFVIQANESLEKNNGEGIVVLSKGDDTKHATSLQAKVSLINTILSYAKKGKNTEGIVAAIKEVYKIGNITTPDKIIDLFNNYLADGRAESGQTMIDASASFDTLTSALIRNSREVMTDMLIDMGYEGDGYFDKTKLKNGVKLATTKGVKTMFADLLQEDFLKGVNNGAVYAAIKFTSKLKFEVDKTHPSYPIVIKTVDGSPVKLEVFNKTFNSYGKEGVAITGVDRNSENAFGVATTTKPNFKLNPDFEDNSSQKDLSGSLDSYESLKDNKKPKQSQKPEKPSLISKTPKAKYLTEDGEGNYVFYHYSNNDLTKKGIDPNKVGKNIITSRGEKLLAPASFYYTEPNIQEPGTGDYGHVVKVPMDKVYPFNEDPLGLVKIAEERFRKKYPNQAFDANKELAWTSVVAQENGYDMTVANWGGVRGMKGALRAQSPVKLKPEMWRKPKEGSYGQVEINEELDYKSNRKKKVQKQEPENEITDQELKRAINLLNDKFGGNEVKFTKFLLGTEGGKDLLARGISQAVAKKTGAKPSQSNKTRVESVDNRLINSEKISDELKSKIQAAGTQSEVYSNEEAKEVADAYVAEHGVDGAVQIADEYLKGSVKMFVYGAAIDKISQDIDAAKTQEEKDALAEKGAEVADRMQKNAEEYGRFIQAIGTFYKNSPLIIAKREVNRLEKASQDAFNRMVNKKDKVEKTNQGLNYVKKKNVNTEALNKIKTPKSAKEKTTELTRLRDLWGSLKGKGQRQLSDYSAEQIDVLHRMAVIFYADGKQAFSSLFKTLREETGISKSDFNELINSKLPSDISADGMSIVDLANEVNKPLVERVSSDKVEKSDIEKILEAGNREKSGKSQNVPQKLYAIYAELNKENKKAMYEDIKNNPDKTEAELLAEWSAELNNQEQQQVIDKYFPEKPTENKKERKAEHEKIIEAYNSGVVNNRAGDKFKELFFDKFGLPKANTEETIKFIDEISKKLAKAPEGSILWRETYEDLLDYIADKAYQNALKSGMDRLSAMWYANILSSPATHLRNLQYNAAQALVLNPLMILEKALLKGDFGQFSNINKGMIEGLKKGATETGRVFRTGRGTRFDGIVERSLADRKLKFFSPVGRLLRGSDIFFSDTAYQLKVREFARAMVKEEHPNWNNEEVDAKVNELMGQTKERKEFASRQAEAELSKFYGDNKPKDYETIKKIREFEIIEQTMPENLKDKLEESKNWAKRTLLTNKPTGIFGVVSELVGKLNNSIYPMRFIIPFINVPLNVAQGMIERSPLGLIKAASTNFLHEKMSDKFEYLNPDQKKELTLKAINYTVAMAVLMMLNGDDDDDELVITGNNTGNYTTDDGIVHGGGLEPMSVYVGGKKIMSYKTSPFAAMLLPVGLVRDSKLYGEKKDISDVIANTFINYMLFINDASAMQGLQGIMGAVADKKTDRAESTKKWFAKQANSLIPYAGAIKYITNTVNAARGEYDTRPIEMREYILKDLPFIQDYFGMSTRKDHFGQPKKEKFDVPLLPVGHRGLAKDISDISPYYKLAYEKGYIEELKYMTNSEFTVGGKPVKLSKKELDNLSARRGVIVKEALDHKNVFKSKLKPDSKKVNMTTFQYLETLDNETFKKRMDQLFEQAGDVARIEHFGEEIGLTKTQIDNFLIELQEMKNPNDRKKEKELGAPTIRQNKKALKDYKEKNLEIILESL